MFSFKKETFLKKGNKKSKKICNGNIIGSVLSFENHVNMWIAKKGNNKPGRNRFTLFLFRHRQSERTKKKTDKSGGNFSR